MGTMASLITCLTSVYSTVHSGAAQRKHQSFASLAFVRGIHRRTVNSPHKWPVTRKCFHLMTSSCQHHHHHTTTTPSPQLLLVNDLTSASGMRDTARVLDKNPSHKWRRKTARIIMFSLYTSPIIAIWYCYFSCVNRSPLNVHGNMMTSSNGNIFRVTGPLCGEFTGHRWIPLTKASDAELWFFLWSVPE